VLDGNSRPILIYANIKDIMKTSTGYKAIFANFFNLPISDLYYELILSKKQVDYLLAQNKFMYDNYAIVANINQIDREISKIDIYEGYGENQVQSFIDIPGYFIMKGTCLDILFVGDSVKIYDWEWIEG